jgi:hypothetical protein
MSDAIVTVSASTPIVREVRPGRVGRVAVEGESRPGPARVRRARNGDQDLVRDQPPVEAHREEALALRVVHDARVEGVEGGGDPRIAPEFAEGPIRQQHAVALAEHRDAAVEEGDDLVGSDGAHRVRRASAELGRVEGELDLERGSADRVAPE